jgi:hypothetical protein
MCRHYLYLYYTFLGGDWPSFWLATNVLHVAEAVSTSLM